MRIKRLLLSLFIVFAIFTYTPYIIAFLAGEKLVRYNSKLEGARILFTRMKLLDGDFPADKDIYFAGTSRTMADFSASRVASYINENGTLDHDVSAFNLGNTANSLILFDAFLTDDNKSDILILEMNPYQFMNDFDYRIKGNFNRYRRKIEAIDTYIKGYAGSMVGVQDSFKYGPHSIKAIRQTIFNGHPSLKEFYYYHLSHNCYGQTIQEDGQVFYRVQVRNADETEWLKRNCSEYDNNKRNLQGEFNPGAWAAFTRIVNKYQGSGQLIVVRPPVSPEIYKMEDEMSDDLFDRITAYLSENDVPYIDLNPHNYHLSDMSHVDWYDTYRLSEELARRMLPLIDRSVLN